MEHAPAAGAVASRSALDDIGITIVRFANGVEAWLKPTDFKNDQVLFALNAPGGASLAPPADFVEATLATGATSAWPGVGGLKALDLEKMLTGKIASAQPFISCRRRASRAAPRRRSSKRRCSCSIRTFTAPGDDPDAFALMKKQLEAAVANRGRAPAQVFGEKLSAGEHVEPLHLAAADAGARRLARPREDDRVLPARASPTPPTSRSSWSARSRSTRPCRCWRATSARCRPPASATSTFKDVGDPLSRRPTSASRSKQGREPRGQTVISFFADPSPDPHRAGKYRRRDDGARHRAARHPARGSRADLHGQRRPVAAAAAARRAATSRSASGPRPRTCESMTAAGDAGDQAPAEGGTVRRPHQPRQGIGAARLRDVAEAERLLDGTAADRSTTLGLQPVATS